MVAVLLWVKEKFMKAAKAVERWVKSCRMIDDRPEMVKTFFVEN